MKKRLLWIFILLISLCNAAYAETVYKILKSSREVRAAAGKMEREGCTELAYSAYAYPKYEILGKDEKDELRIKVRNDFEKKRNKDLREKQGLPQYIGYRIGLTIGFDELAKITDPTPAMISAYKVSACAIKKADELRIHDARMISFALWVIDADSTGTTKMKVNFKNIAEKGFFDMDLFSEFTNQLSITQCDIPFNEARKIHWDYVDKHYLKGKGITSSLHAELNKQCLLGVSQAMPFTFYKAINDGFKK